MKELKVPYDENNTESKKMSNFHLIYRMLKTNLSCLVILFILLTFCLQMYGQNSSIQNQKHVWKQLFNGKDLTGWKHVGSGYMTVEDSMIVTHGGMGLLYWAGDKFGNCVIRVIFKMKDENCNSGVFIRIPIEPRETWMPVCYGYEIQIDNHPERSGDEAYRSMGTIYSFTKPKAIAREPRPIWNKFEITLDGPHTIVMLNGVKVTDFTEGDPVPDRKSVNEPCPGRRPEKGYIGIQNFNEQSLVFFKEIAVSPLK